MNKRLSLILLSALFAAGMGTSHVMAAGKGNVELLVSPMDGGVITQTYTDINVNKDLGVSVGSFMYSLNNYGAYTTLDTTLGYRFKLPSMVKNSNPSENEIFAGLRYAGGGSKDLIVGVKGAKKLNQQFTLKDKLYTVGWDGLDNTLQLACGLSKDFELRVGLTQHISFKDGLTFDYNHLAVGFGYNF